MSYRSTENSSRLSARIKGLNITSDTDSCTEELDDKELSFKTVSDNDDGEWRGRRQQGKNSTTDNDDSELSGAYGLSQESESGSSTGRGWCFFFYRVVIGFFLQLLMFRWCLVKAARAAVVCFQVKLQIVSMHYKIIICKKEPFLKFQTNGKIISRSIFATSHWSVLSLKELFLFYFRMLCSFFCFVIINVKLMLLYYILLLFDLKFC